MNNPSPGEKELITIVEAADYYNLSMNYLRKYIRNNDCRSFTIVYYNDRKLILRPAFESFLRANPNFKEMMKIDASRQRKSKKGQETPNITTR